MDLVSRLKQYLDFRQISVTQFADECSIPRPTGSQLLAGRNKKVSDEIISKIHLAYPDLSIVWLMFGEGDMTTNANIKISEPQNHDIFSSEPTEQADMHEFTSSPEFVNSITENLPEKNTFSFTPDHSQPTIEFPAEQPKPETEHIPTQQQPEAERKDVKETITLTPGKGKRVTGIVVYYDDSTYESFIPDPSHRHPFMP